ncbi:AAA family ATPase [Desulfosarcina ovata]|uniref:ATPase n=1 Tax=Desulfosarcina ovata subsp. ovata TaxID=2752305 RepID=A0A5K8AAY9_9BACT|nr:MoxR family ATPase [Desulfosarcina ovata]BBO89757.1 ATPase [Desulfosarcina ovata subsp. ovata]
MKPSRIIETLKTLITIRQPVFVWGAPGVGKSQVVAQVARQAGVELVDIRAVLLDPVDLRGLPRIDDSNRACWCPPDFLPINGKGVLFLDELNAAPPLVQAACYQLVLDRRLGEYRLPDGWSIVAAGNRETDRAVTHRMPSALANRFVHLNFEVDDAEWLAWAQAAGVAVEVSAFVRFRTNLLHAFDPQKDDKAFPTPRSWEFVSRIMNSRTTAIPDLELIAGAVGEGAAAEFCGFLRVFRDLPDPQVLIDSPETADVPDDPATLYAVCELLSQKTDLANLPRIMTYAKRLPPEFSVLLVRDAARINSAIVETPAFNDWAVAHADVLI